MPQSDKYKQNNCLGHSTPLSLLHRKQLRAMILMNINWIMAIIHAGSETSCNVLNP